MKLIGNVKTIYASKGVYIFALMQLNTVIFDMDGLLIDSEPLWYLAAKEVFEQYGVQFTLQQYSAVIGLRTKEFVDLWFRNFNLPESKIPEAEEAITKRVVELIQQKGK